MLYLSRSRKTFQEYIRVDSGQPNGEHRYHLVVSPDASSVYRLMLGDNLIGYDLYLAPGDSLFISYDPLRGDSLVFDRLGANRFYRNDVKPWFRDKQYYHNSDSLDWDGWRDYLAGLRGSFQARAAQIRVQFPEHAALYDAYESNEQEVYYAGLLFYLRTHYWDSTGKAVIDAPDRFKILDSIPWTEEPLAHSDALYGLVSLWTELSWQHWRHAGIDTAGKDYATEAFSLAHGLPVPARDVSELIIFNNATYLSSPAELVPVMEREFAVYRPLASDTTYLNAFEHQLSLLQSLLPQKQAPDFQLPDTAGLPHSLEEFRGKIVYLDFWGTWCGPCLAELPYLAKLEKQFDGNTNIAFVSIALENTENETERIPAWKKFLVYHHMSGTQLYSDNGFLSKTAKDYRIWGVPTFMLINRDGTFIDAAAPRPSSGKAEAEIRSALALH